MTLTGAAPVRGIDPFFGASVDRAIFGPLWEQLGTFITPRIIIFIGVLLIAHFVLLRVRQGRNVYAVGGNAEAARLSGINVAALHVRRIRVQRPDWPAWRACCWHSA